MEFHEKLQELRKQKGLTQEALAEALFVSRAAISKWESGRGYPNIDSLKAMAKFFQVTVDELLSGEELLTVAQEDTRRHLSELVYGLLDCGAALLLFLPLFRQPAAEGVRAVSLLALTDTAPYMLAAYWAILCATVVFGIGTLALQNCSYPLWESWKKPVSLLLSGGSALLFMLGLHPYGAAFAFTFFMIKVMIRKVAAR